MCWAYYPSENKIKEKPEPLNEHLLSVASYILKHPLINPVTHKISRLLSIDTDVIRDIAYLTGLLHDIGKASHRYQEKPENGFSNHEYLSASAINAFFTMENGKDALKKLLIQPIILHHYAQKINVRKVIESSKEFLDKSDGFIIITLYEPCKSALESVLIEGEKQVSTVSAKELLRFLLDNIRRNGYLPVAPPEEDLINYLNSVIFNGEVASVMALTGLLNEADGRIAKNNRKMDR
ncbi:MAG: CRISPR-associated endonuclease Cas3'' [Thermocladium sp.]